MADQSVFYRVILDEQPVQRRYKYLNAPLERLPLQERARGGPEFLCKCRRVRPCVIDFESKIPNLLANSKSWSKFWTRSHGSTGTFRAGDARVIGASLSLLSVSAPYERYKITIHA